MDYSGKQKFSMDQAEKIRKSNLLIGEKYFKLNGVSFIVPCLFSKWLEKPFDTTEFTGSSIEYRYPKEVLATLIVLQPSDKNGNAACFNNCSNFFLKGDTLINICGGYTYYRTRIHK